MARLSSTANFGFVAIPDAVPHILAQFFHRPDHPIRIMDICAGEGVAIGIMAEHWGVPPEDMYLNELHTQRAKRCAVLSPNTLSCDALKGMRGTRHMCQLAYTNPPFDNDAVVEGGGRLEVKFCKRILEDFHLIQPGGWHIIVAPLDIFLRREFINHLARCYDIEFVEAGPAARADQPAPEQELHRAIWVLPAEIRRYREAIVIGQVREHHRVGSDHLKEAHRIQRILERDLPVLSAPQRPWYSFPAPAPLPKLIWRDATPGTPEDAAKDVAASGGAWTSAAYRADRAGMHREQLRPLFPLSPPQAMLRIAAGAINGTEIPIGGVPQTIKGSTIEEAVTWDDEKQNERSHVTTHHRVVRRVPHVVTVDRQGRIRRFIGDHGMRALTGMTGVTDALLDAVTAAAPPIISLQMDPEISTIFNGIKPASGRALPGQPVGLLLMQKLVAAGVVTVHRTRRGLFLVAEMGCGKTPIGAAVAQAEYTLGW